MEFNYYRAISVIPWCQASVGSVDLYTAFLRLQTMDPLEPGFKESYRLLCLLFLPVEVNDAYVVLSVPVSHIINKLSKYLYLCLRVFELLF